MAKPAWNYVHSDPVDDRLHPYPSTLQVSLTHAALDENLATTLVTAVCNQNDGPEIEGAMGMAEKRGKGVIKIKG